MLICSKCGKTIANVDHSTIRLGRCASCGISDITAQGSSTTVNRESEHSRTKGSGIMWQTGQGNDGLVTREEAIAHIERKADEQGIGQGFKVYYDGRMIDSETDLPERCDLTKIRVSASLNQAHEWCSISGIVLTPAELKMV